MRKLNPAKFKRMSKTLRVVITVFFWAAIFLSALSLIAICIIALNPDSLLKLSNPGRISFYNGMGIANYRLEPNMYGADKLKPVFLAIFSALLIWSFMFSIILRQVGHILKTVEKDCPFAEKNASRLTIIGVVLIIGSFVFNAAQSAIVYTMIQSFQIPNLNFTLGLDVSMLTTGCLILILAGVFKYGSFLQQEFDSTL